MTINKQRLREDLSRLTPPNTAREHEAILRELYDDIEARLRIGSSHLDVLRVLQANGVSMTLVQFRIALYAIRREKGIPVRRRRKKAET